jgi:hypothetical protein
MIRAFVRLIGILLLSLAFIFLVYDGAKTIAGSRLHVTPLGQVWNEMHSTSLQLLQPAIERHVHPFLWDPIVLNVLTAPVWLVVGILGGVLILLGQRPRPLIGYGR